MRETFWKLSKARFKVIGGSFHLPPSNSTNHIASSGGGFLLVWQLPVSSGEKCLQSLWGWNLVRFCSNWPHRSLSCLLLFLMKPHWSLLLLLKWRLSFPPFSGWLKMFQIRSFLRWMGEILGAQSVFAVRLPVCGKSFLVIKTETKEEKKIIVMEALI